MNNLIDPYNNTHHHSIGKKTINVDYSALTEKSETNPKALKFKVSDRVKITTYKNIFSTGYIKYWSIEIFIINSALKTNPWKYEIKDLSREKIFGSFYEKDLLLSKL